ncbi:NAD-binding protein [archaeon]|nr:NAD-binding protein [archaeon]
MGRDINIPYVVVDQNPDKIIPLIKKKVNCVCGDINNEEVINSLRLLNAKAVILTLPRFDTIIRFLKTGKTINPKLIVYCRAENKDQVLKLYEHGADLVILPKVLESNFLLEKINVLISKGSDNLSSYKSPYIDYLKRDLK